MTRLIFLCVFMLLPLFCLTGCNIIGGTAQLLAPPEKIEAKYDMPDKPTLIVIEDWEGKINNESLLRQIAGSTRAALEAENVVTTGFIGQDELAAYREELGERYKKTSLAGLAIKLGAKQVIHAEVTGYQMAMGGNVVRPAITLNVKVFDLDERERVFPAESDPETGLGTGMTVYPLQSRRPAQDLTGQSAARSIAARELAEQAGRDLGRLFFDWRVQQPGSELGDQ